MESAVFVDAEVIDSLDESQPAIAVKARVHAAKPITAWRQSGC
ncbi:MAG: hypothetical protein ACE361_07745 [Aureliella sp.]